MSNITPRDIAEKLYELNCDMDCHDYDDTKEDEIKQLEDAIYEVKYMAEDGYEQDYYMSNCFKTFYKALKSLCN